jgi:hypothetical protein
MSFFRNVLFVATAITASTGCMPPGLAPSSTPANAETEAAEPASTTGAKSAETAVAAPIPDGVPTATIKGERVGYRRSSIVGNNQDKRGFAITMFELDDPAQIRGEINAHIDGPLVKGKALPVEMTFLQIGDNGPKSQEGVRNISAAGCAGKGELFLDTVPKLPAPTTERKEVGEAKGKLKVDVTCHFELEKEFGSFTIAGPITLKVTTTK